MTQFIKKDDVVNEIMRVADGERYLPIVLETLENIKTYICTAEEEKELLCTVNHYDRLEQTALHYGSKLQVSKTIEEIGELLTLLGRMQVGEVNILDLVGEIADVYNMLDQLCILFDIEDTVQNMSEYKMLRCVSKIEGEINE